MGLPIVKSKVALLDHLGPHGRTARGYPRAKKWHLRCAVFGVIHSLFPSSSLMMVNCFVMKENKRCSQGQRFGTGLKTAFGTPAAILECVGLRLNFVCSSSFLRMRTLGGSSNGSSPQVPASHTGDLDGVLGCQFSLVQPKRWGSEPAGGVFSHLSILFLFQPFREMY